MSLADVMEITRTLNTLDGWSAVLVLGCVVGWTAAVCYAMYLYTREGRG